MSHNKKKMFIIILKQWFELILLFKFNFHFKTCWFAFHFARAGVKSDVRAFNWTRLKTCVIASEFESLLNFISMQVIDVIHLADESFESKIIQHKLCTTMSVIECQFFQSKSMTSSTFQWLEVFENCFLATNLANVHTQFSCPPDTRFRPDQFWSMSCSHERGWRMEKAKKVKQLLN